MIKTDFFFLGHMKDRMKYLLWSIKFSSMGQKAQLDDYIFL